MKTLNYLIILFFLSIASLFVSCTDNNPVEFPTSNSGITTNEDLSAYLENVVSTKNIPGFSVNVSIDNAVAYQESFGFANIANQIPYTNQTVNNIASVSKTFLGAATAKALEQGLFTLETDINELLPIDVINPKQPNSTIKIKHLVTHTSGIIDVPDTYISSNYFILTDQNINTSIADIMVNQLGIQQMEQVDLDEYLFEIFHQEGELYSLNNYLDAVPGQTWAYSNDATSLLGYIIEYVSGVSFDEYVANNILTPLQMTNSTFNLSDVNFDAVATQYYDLNSPFPKYGNHGYVEGGLYSNSNDMSNYLLDMMRGARGDAGALFSSQYYDVLFTEQLQNGIVPSDFAENHGLFWYMNNDAIMHGGNSLGVSSHIQFKKDGSSGFFILSNMDATFAGNDAKWLEVQTLITNAIEEYIANH